MHLQMRFNLLHCIKHNAYSNQNASTAKAMMRNGIDAWKSTEVICEPASHGPVFAQLDGEPAGQLPLSFSVVPNALSIVTPAALAV